MKKIIAAALTFAPGIAFAQQISDANGLVNKFINIGNTVVTILISFAVIWIIFNVVRYLVIGGSSEEGRKTAGHAILWGVIGLFVILSIWGLVRIFSNTFQTDRNAPVNEFPRLTNPQGQI